jgi:hypothetical protein
MSILFVAKAICSINKDHIDTGWEIGLIMRGS